MIEYFKYIKTSWNDRKRNKFTKRVYKRIWGQPQAFFTYR